MSPRLLEVATSLRCFKLNPCFKYRGESQGERVEPRMVERCYSKFLITLLLIQ